MASRRQYWATGRLKSSHISAGQAPAAHSPPARCRFAALSGDFTGAGIIRASRPVIAIALGDSDAGLVSGDTSPEARFKFLAIT